MENKGSTLTRKIVNELKASFPVIFTRAYAAAHLGGLISKTTLSTLKFFDGKPTPISYSMAGKQVFYREEFFQWFMEYYGIVPGPEEDEDLTEELTDEDFDDTVNLPEATGDDE